MMIRARGLAQTYRPGKGAPPVHAVKGVDMNVRPGEIVGFLGPNGAGKTTTMRMLTTLLRPTAGQANIGGFDLMTDPQRVRGLIGYVAQHNGSSPESTVEEEILLQARLHRLSDRPARLRIRELLGLLELDEVRRRLTRTLSGGQRRRLDLALSLVHRPALLFLDEPTTGLDPQSRHNLWNQVRTLRGQHGMTVFITTHYLDEADALADRILVIDDGRIVAQGTPRELKARVSRGDVVAVSVPAAFTRATAEVAYSIAGMRELQASNGLVRFRVPNGDLAVSQLMGPFMAAGIMPTSMQVLQPTLDDVFLALTGRSLREAKEGETLVP